MIVSDKTVVSVNYKLTVSNEQHPQEELVEETSEARPFVFLFGTGGLLEEFEKNLNGLKKQQLQQLYF